MTAFFCQKHPIKVFIQTSLVEAMPHQSVIQPSMSLCASPVEHYALVIIIFEKIWKI